MPLPSPYDYDDWQSFAAALLGSLTDGTGDVVASGVSGSSGGVTTGGGGATDTPPGWDIVYWNGALDQMFLGSSFLTAPPIVTPFQIDTASLALASVTINQIADGAVGTNKIQDLAVVNAKIGNATILSAKIGDLQVITAKIADLAVLTAKIGDAQINSAKIANLAVDQARIALLAVGAAQIIDLSVGTAKIANAAITNVQIASATILSANIGLAQITSALIASLAVLSANIADANVLTAKIADGSITTAKIFDAAITTAKIGLAQIVNANIADATIDTAKIANLVVNKLTSGTLDAVIDVGAGILRFTIGGNRLSIGRGFGTSSQFIMWFGPSMAESAMSELSAVFYLKTDGSAFFGGSLLAGTLTNSARTSDIGTTATIVDGPFGTLGHTRTYTVSYSYHAIQSFSAGPTGISPSTPSATIVLEQWNGSSWTTLSTQTFTGSATRTAASGGDPGSFDATNSGSFTYTDSSGGTTDIQLRARITSRTDALPTGGTGSTPFSTTQNLGVVSIES